jgi:GrpB-like predicted nucleotidyltransferase (UPF0157 family)
MSDTLVIVPYDPAWPRAFATERDRIAAVFGTVAQRIDHNGSTSVPGLAAKPIIDTQISVASLRPLSAHVERLARLGYTHVPHPDDTFCPFFHRPAVWPYTHHVHVVESGGDEERRTLAFRDYLRTHDDVARDYEALKRRIAPHHAATDFASRQAYADAKAPFIAAVVERALSEGYPRDTKPS